MRAQKALDVVDGVVAALAKANLTSSNDKVYVAAEDSSALAAFQKLIPQKLVYRVPYDPNNPVEVTLPVLQVCLHFEEFLFGYCDFYSNLPSLPDFSFREVGIVVISFKSETWIWVTRFDVRRDNFSWLLPICRWFTWTG